MPWIATIETSGHNAARVLVVEDNPVNQEVTRRMAEGLGCQVDVAANGREALTAVEQSAYDLVLMDCQMPEMDGFEATRAIRRRESERNAERGMMNDEQNQPSAFSLQPYLASPSSLSLPMRWRVIMSSVYPRGWMIISANHLVRNNLTPYFSTGCLDVPPLLKRKSSLHKTATEQLLLSIILFCPRSHRILSMSRLPSLHPWIGKPSITFACYNRRGRRMCYRK
jgi:CheY-like chemotaxis protein